MVADIIRHYNGVIFRFGLDNVLQKHKTKPYNITNTSLKYRGRWKSDGKFEILFQLSHMQGV